MNSKDQQLRTSSTDSTTVVLIEKDSAQKQQPIDGNMQWKRYSSLVFLALQNAILVLVARYSRTMPGERFFSTTAVCVQEAVKLLASALIIICSEGGISGLIGQINKYIIKAPLDTLRVSVPAILYMIQNNLFYVAVSNLPAATFQVVFQTKILTTAMFAVLILHQKLSLTKWLSLFILTAGIAAVQIETTVSKEQKEQNSENQKPIVGFVAIIIASLTSGFAGVYFEKILKEAQVSVWLRNIQLAIFGFSLGMVAVYITDGEQVLKLGFFYGYNRWTVAVILNQALGGLIIACVVKYADNILKGFATSIAIIVSCIFSTFLFNFQITPIFITGAAMVIGSVCLYSGSK
ncbi:UDP-galactose translocator-like isoform X2 [Convolutriloba macropyga]